jgi:hypothetical protein
MNHQNNELIARSSSFTSRGVVVTITDRLVCKAFDDDDEGVGEEMALVIDEEREEEAEREIDERVSDISSPNHFNNSTRRRISWRLVDRRRQSLNERDFSLLEPQMNIKHFLIFSFEKRCSWR